MINGHCGKWTLTVTAYAAQQSDEVTLLLSIQFNEFQMLFLWIVYKHKHY